jgi:hypothetical protein
MAGQPPNSPVHQPADSPIRGSPEGARILIVAGEASGDLHGARLVEALRRLTPRLAVEGMGGAQMQKAGVTLLADAGDKIGRAHV